jgi:hypothetical protein
MSYFFVDKDVMDVFTADYGMYRYRKYVKKAFSSFTHSRRSNNPLAE